MAEYIVKTPWTGVKKGQVIKADKLHPSIAAHVIAAPSRDGDEQVDKTLVVNPSAVPVKELQAEIADSTDRERLAELAKDSRTGVQKAVEKRLTELADD